VGLAGVARIVAFNWPKYATAVMLLCGVSAALVLLDLNRAVLVAGWVGLGFVAWWTAASLIASWWVYDLSGMYELRWLAALMKHSGRWVSIHAGLDGFTAPARVLFECEPMSVLDIYDPREMTERSIARARLTQKPHPRTLIANSGKLPLPDASCDAILLLFAAHELRSTAAREKLFREMRRLLAQDGKIIVAEHLRDVANFAAFGPGFLHFISRDLWLEAFAAAGLSVESEIKITPFVRAFVLRSDP
jgi:SAM-dependent methyltransferase